MNKTEQYSLILKSSTISNGGIGVFTVHDIYSGVAKDYEKLKDKLAANTSMIAKNIRMRN